MSLISLDDIVRGNPRAEQELNALRIELDRLDYVNKRIDAILYRAITILGGENSEAGRGILDQRDEALAKAKED